MYYTEYEITPEYEDERFFPFALGLGLASGFGRPFFPRRPFYPPFYGRPFFPKRPFYSYPWWYRRRFWY